MIERRFAKSDGSADGWPQSKIIAMCARFLFLCGIAAGLCAQENPTELLRRLREKVASSLDHLPRYMCTETVHRSEYEPDDHDRGNHCDEALRKLPKTHLATSDRLRLDVGTASTMEMYSWAGENHFSNRDLFYLVDDGTMSNGTYASFLTAIFRGEDANFTYHGESKEHGRAVAEFGFSVPLERSHYLYGNGGQHVVTGYDGTLIVDVQTSDLVRLSVRTSGLPPETSACYASTELTYARVRLQDFDFLLPSQTRLNVLHTDGAISENHTVFSNCHEFRGEAKLSFDQPDSAAPHNAAVPGVEIPPGLPFRVALTETIDPVTAAAGDPIKAKLITPIGSSRNVLVPKGATVSARIVRIRHYYKPLGAYVVLDITLENVHVAGTPVDLHASPEAATGFSKGPNGALIERFDMGALRAIEKHAATFVFRDAKPPTKISEGLESKWTTIALDPTPVPGK
jgi:hypothetical protein